MSGGDFGPAVEQMRLLTATQRALADQAFWHAVAPVSDGELFFPAPFDLRTSAVLATNFCRGSVAVHSFVELYYGTKRQYRVVAEEVVNDLGGTTWTRDGVRFIGTAAEVAAGLLDEVAMELESNEGATDG